MITRAREGAYGELHGFVAGFAQDVAEANSRGHNGYWGDPVPNMGTYPLNAVRHLFDQNIFYAGWVFETGITGIKDCIR